MLSIRSSSLYMFQEKKENQFQNNQVKKRGARLLVTSPMMKKGRGTPPMMATLHSDDNTCRRISYSISSGQIKGPVHGLSLSLVKHHPCFKQL